MASSVWVTPSQIGDNEVPASVGPINVGGPVLDVSAAGNVTCALLVNGGVRCWGRNAYGQLGQDHVLDIGDNELPSSVGTVPVGGVVDELFLGARNTCARMGSDIKCWGEGTYGFNGYGNTEHLGDNELPSSYGMVDTGIAADASRVVNDRSQQTCAVDGAILRCWGRNEAGQLGYGHILDIGDDEVPASAGDVSY